MKCPKCQANWKQYKAGFNPSGSQRYRCGECNRVYTPKPIQQSYPEETRLLAIRMYVEGSSFGKLNPSPSDSVALSKSTWLDMGKPWAVFTAEDVVYNVDVSQYIRQKGPWFDIDS